MIRALALALVVACGSNDELPSVVETHDSCGGVITRVPSQGGDHVDASTAIEWNSNPPTSGPHFQVWAAFDRHYDSLPRGNWVHDLEHGAYPVATDGCAGVLGRCVVRQQPAPPNAPGAEHKQSRCDA